MAAFYPTLCNLCIENNNKVYRKSVTLCCGHDFCLECLALLKNSSSCKCPICGGSWAELEGEALAVEDRQKPMSRQRKKDYSNCKKNDGHDLCKVHDLPYHLWCNEDKDFYFFECAVVTGSKKLLFAKDAIPRIRSELNQKFVESAQQIKSDIVELKNLKNEFKLQLITIGRYEEAILKHKRDIEQNISDMESLKTDKLNDSLLVDKLKGRIEKIESDLDVSLALKSLTILKDRVQLLGAPVMTDDEVLLCNVASAYMVSSGSKTEEKRLNLHVTVV